MADSLLVKPAGTGRETMQAFRGRAQFAGWMNPVAQEIKAAVDAADKSLLPVKFKPQRERHREQLPDVAAVYQQNKQKQRSVRLVYKDYKKAHVG